MDGAAVDSSAATSGPVALAVYPPRFIGDQWMVEALCGTHVGLGWGRTKESAEADARRRLAYVIAVALRGE